MQFTGLDSILLSSDESEDSDIKSDPTFSFNLLVALPPLLLLSMLLRAMELVDFLEKDPDDKKILTK